MKLREFKHKLLQNPEIKEEFSKYDLALEISEMLIKARIIKGMTQDKLAHLMHTKQESISRAEKGNHLPSLSFLQKIASALNAQLKVYFDFTHKGKIDYTYSAKNSHNEDRIFRGDQYSYKYNSLN
jgi:transcriptional regulator with XRE-family HTH domain